MTDVNPAPFYSGDDIGTLVIERPTASNEKVKVILSYEDGIIRNETDEECCQPDLETDKLVDDGEDEPCSAFPVTVQATTQIPDDDHACLLYYDIILADEEIEVTYFNLVIDFEISGEAELQSVVTDFTVFLGWNYWIVLTRSSPQMPIIPNRLLQLILLLFER